MEPMEPLVDYIARWLVDEPDAIEISSDVNVLIIFTFGCKCVSSKCCL